MIFNLYLKKMSYHLFVIMNLTYAENSDKYWILFYLFNNIDGDISILDLEMGNKFEPDLKKRINYIPLIDIEQCIGFQLSLRRQAFCWVGVRGHTHCLVFYPLKSAANDYRLTGAGPSGPEHE